MNIYAKIMTDGQITLPEEVRNVLGVSEGDNVAFIVENGTVILANPAVYAMQELQTQMKDEEKNGLNSEEEIAAFVNEMRFQ